MVKLECWKCGTEIQRKKAKVKASKTKRFVCSECYSKGRGEYIQCRREGCEIVFYAYPSDIARGKMYCSQPCCKAEQSRQSQGSRYQGKDGYVRILQSDHPNARKDGRVNEHTIVMSEILNRPLLPKEEVHHKNGVRNDNSPGNLELWSYSQPRGQRVEDKIEWAIEFLTQYGYDIKKEI